MAIGPSHIDDSMLCTKRIAHITFLSHPKTWEVWCARAFPGPTSLTASCNHLVDTDSMFSPKSNLTLHDLEFVYHLTTSVVKFTEFDRCPAEVQKFHLPNSFEFSHCLNRCGKWHDFSSANFFSRRQQYLTCSRQPRCTLSEFASKHGSTCMFCICHCAHAHLGNRHAMSVTIRCQHDTSYRFDMIWYVHDGCGQLARATRLLS